MKWSMDCFLNTVCNLNTAAYVGIVAIPKRQGWNRSNCWLQTPSCNASYLFHISGEIAHLSMRCYGRLSLWGVARHSHAHGRCELSWTAGVMLNVRRSDRNANQVSKLTLHSHRCTSDLQWFISQSESMCHCVECPWVNTALAKVHHLAAPTPSTPRPSISLASHQAWTALSMRATDSTAEE